MQRTPARVGGPEWLAFPPGCTSPRSCERPQPESRGSFGTAPTRGQRPPSFGLWFPTMHRALKCALREVTELRPQLRSWEGLRDAGRASRGGGASGGRGGAGPEAAVSAVGSSCAAVAGSRRCLGRTILSLGDLSTQSCDKVGGAPQEGGRGCGCRVFSYSNWRRLTGPAFRQGAIRSARRGLF